MRNSHVWHRVLVGGLGAGLALSALGVPTAAGAAPATPAVIINEVIQNNPNIADAIELYNAGSASVDLSGWIVADDKNQFALEAGTLIEAGAYLVITTDEGRDDGFGLGKEDQANLRLADGTTVDSFSWSGHQSTSYGRCPDITGPLVPTVAATPGAANACVAPAAGNVVINEVESSAPDEGDDWVEFFNTSVHDIDLGGLVLSDSNPSNSYTLPAGTMIAAGGYLVITETEFDFGLGGTDAVHLHDGGELVDNYAWSGHADHSYGRCPDGVGDFAQTAAATPGAANDCAPVDAPNVRVNEVETNNGDPGDWIELVNLEAVDVDLSGWVVRDNDDAHISVLPEGSIITAGGFFIVEESQLGFGLGKEDAARIYLPGGHTLVDSYYWTATADDQHAPTTFGRCPDGTGEWQITTAPTKGAANDCGVALRINEVESNGDAIGDWVELVNVGFTEVDLSGMWLEDTSDNGPHTFAAGTTLGAGEYLREYVFDTFGLGGNDAVTLFSAEGEVLDTIAWRSHAATTLGRCPDGTGEFAETREATPGAMNACAGDLITDVWPGPDMMQPVDTPNTFGADMSGAVFDANGTIWTVNNGNGTLHQLSLEGDSLTELARYTLRYGDGLGTVDAEGVALVGGHAANGVLVASERNTGTGTRGSRPSVLLYDVTDVEAGAEAGAELLAAQEWNLSEYYPGIGANAGLEGVAWIADATLVASGLVDEQTGEVYDPSLYPAHLGGVVFVGVEATSRVAGYVLGDGGEIVRITEFDTAFHGVMELEYDAQTGVLWVLCDDACEGRSQLFTIDESGAFAAVSVVERPAGTANIANEGFAISTAVCENGERLVIWADDSQTDGFAFRVGAIQCEAELPGDGGADAGAGSGSGGSGDGGSATTVLPPADTAMTAVPQLSTTGADTVLPLVGAAGLLVFAGLAFLGARRRAARG